MFSSCKENCVCRPIPIKFLYLYWQRRAKPPKIFPLFKCISCLPYCYRLCCDRPIYSPKKGKSTTGGRKTKLGKNRRKCGCHLAKQSRTNWAQRSPSPSEAAGREQSTILLLSAGPCQGCWGGEPWAGRCWEQITSASPYPEENSEKGEWCKLDTYQIKVSASFWHFCLLHAPLLFRRGQAGKQKKNELWRRNGNWLLDKGLAGYLIFRERNLNSLTDSSELFSSKRNLCHKSMT